MYANLITRDQRCRGEFRAFSWATVKEAVAHVKTAQEETIAEKSPGASRSRTVQSVRPEQPLVIGTLTAFGTLNIAKLHCVPMCGG